MGMLPGEGAEDPTAEMPPMDDMNGGLPPTPPNGVDAPDTGDGMQDNQESDDEGIDIYNSLPVEKKSAAIKYMKSMQDDEEDAESNSNGGNEGGAPEMPMESKLYIEKLVTEIANGIISDFDMNDREGVKGTKRDEKQITNKRLSNGRGTMNPFVSGR